jgi:hypothetical protein
MNHFTIPKYILYPASINSLLTSTIVTTLNKPLHYDNEDMRSDNKVRELATVFAMAAVDRDLSMV